MGDPRRIKKKYQGPSHPWQKLRIEEEKVLFKDYGLRNKKEIWKMNSLLRSYKQQVKKLIANQTKQAEKERSQLIKKLYNMGLIQKTAKIEDILGLTLNNLMDRRLQTFVCKKGFARTPNQARQFIVHRHVKVDDRKINSPSYLVLRNDEEKISLTDRAKAIMEAPLENKETKKHAPKEVKE